jgi:rfaE bifunctional protein nucleotidyltransferase chain/domain
MSSHLDGLPAALARNEGPLRLAERWGARLADILTQGGRLLVAGNGGSAAQAQHLSAELVGRYRDERAPFSAIALSTDTSALTAIANDYGIEELFSRQVRAHGRPGDVCILMSTSGRSPNVLAAAAAAREAGLQVWAMTGAGPNPLADAADEAMCIDADETATVQELHLVALHEICECFDAALNVPAVPREAGPVLPREPGQSGSVVVVGDALLDIDVETSSDRLVPDTAAPVLDEQARTERPGGAALAASLAAADGTGPVTLVTALPDDSDGARVRALLGDRVRIISLPCLGSTGVKMRLCRGDQVLARLDRGGAGVEITSVGDDVADALASADTVLVSDYGRGVVGHPDMLRLLQAAATRRPLVWDPHPRGPDPVPGARLVTPNSGEAARATGERPAQGVADACRQARALVQHWGAAGVALTLGSHGAVLATDTGNTSAFPVPRTVDGDPCGAGDRFASRLATALAAGALPSEAVTAGVQAASAFLAAGGVAAVDNLGWAASDAPATEADEPAVADELAVANEAAVADDAAELLARVRARGGTVVATGGCFDLLHAGHVSTLTAARSLGDCLVVCLNSDESVRRQKGEGRPLQSAADRARVLRGLSAVDAVVVFDDDTPEHVLTALRPDVWVKGGDYSTAELPEAAIVRSWGGEVVTVPYVRGRSTSRLVSLARS